VDSNILGNVKNTSVIIVGIGLDYKFCGSLFKMANYVVLPHWEKSWEDLGKTNKFSFHFPSKIEKTWEKYQIFPKCSHVFPSVCTKLI